MSFEALLATWELTKKDLNSLEKLLLLSLARRAGEDHTCWPSLKRIEEDTGMDRKTIITYRQNLIDKGFMSYTGEMKGRTKLIPEMRLDYVFRWEMKRNSPRLKDDEPVDKYDDKKLNSTADGTLNSTADGTLNSTADGTLNIKEEYKSGSKSFYAARQKPKNQPGQTRPSMREENERKPEWEKSRQSSVTRGITDTMSEEYKLALQMPPMSEEFRIAQYKSIPRYLVPKQHRHLLT